METAQFITGMRDLSYWILPNEYGDTHVSTHCENIKEALEIIATTGVKQGLIATDRTQKFGYKRILY